MNFVALVVYSVLCTAGYVAYLAGTLVNAGDQLKDQFVDPDGYVCNLTIPIQVKQFAPTFNPGAL